MTKKASKSKTNPKPVYNYTVVRYYLFALIGIALFTFFPIIQNGFVNFDDPQYVTENPYVQELNATNVKLFFTEQFVGNYQPLVMLFYALQYKIFGAQAGAFHFISLLFHIINALLVFKIFEYLFKNIKAAFIVALLFAIHPLHVESVAWVASQKDVFYTLFFLLSIWYYLHYKENVFKKHLILSLLFFVCSILCKAQAVVLPVVLVLFDYFIDNKFQFTQLKNKLFFFLFAFVFGLLALKAQGKAGAMQDFAYFQFHERILFASYAFVMYLYQTVFPMHLSVFYPYPETDGVINNTLVYLAPLIILAILFIVWRYRQEKIVVFGFFFFCVTIALLLQLIPVGDAIRADRYSYISLLGLFAIVGYYFEIIIKQNTIYKYAIYLLGVIFCFRSFTQTKVWKDNLTLYSNAIAISPAPITLSNRGAELYKQSKFTEAANDFSDAIKINPRFPNIFTNRGLTYQQLGKHNEAIQDFTSAIKYNSKDVSIYISRANSYKAIKETDKAISDYSNIIQINPQIVDAYYARAELYGQQNKLSESLNDLNQVIKLKSDFFEAYNNRAIVYSMMGNAQQAVADYSKAIELNPKFFSAYFNRGILYKNTGNYKSAYADISFAKSNGYPVDDKLLLELQQMANK